MPRHVDITRIPANVAIPMAAPPASSITRAAPGAAEAKSLFWVGTPSVFGRIPSVAAEGHEADPWYDTRRNPPGSAAFGGLSGLQSPYEWRSSVWGVQQRIGRSSGLGQAGDEQRLYSQLDEVALDIKAGIDDWRRAGNSGQADLGERFAATWAYALNALTHDQNVAEAGRLVASLYPAVKRWRQAAAQSAGTASREIAGGIVRTRPVSAAPSGGILEQIFGPSFGAGEPGAGTLLTRWGIPIAAITLVFLLARGR